ncbi:hypothetical protein KAX03_01090 [Candidatus Bathyarchaeota archaeon]|nr:hypothetical protein [Candidatus Bathyarchaeota archaeon]
MRKIIKATLHALVYVLILVVIPNISFTYISQSFPKEIFPLLEGVVNLQNFITLTSIAGLFLAILVFSSNMVDDWSPIKLLTSIASAFTGFYIFLILTGLGDPSRMGLTQLSIEMLNIILDFRFFVSLELILLVINVTNSIVKYYFARKEYLAGH